MSTEKELNYYDVLDVDEDASLDEIKAIWKKWCMVLHPDHVPKLEHIQKKATEFHVWLNRAFSKLSDTNKRAEFDHLRKYGQASDIEDVNLYHILCLPRSASKKEIEEAYKCFIQIFGRNDLIVSVRDLANIQLEQVRLAYSTLSNPRERQKYDALLDRQSVPDDQVNVAEDFETSSSAPSTEPTASATTTATTATSGAATAPQVVRDELGWAAIIAGIAAISVGIAFSLAGFVVGLIPAVIVAVIADIAGYRERGNSIGNDVAKGFGLLGLIIGSVQGAQWGRDFFNRFRPIRYRPHYVAAAAVPAIIVILIGGLFMYSREINYALFRARYGEQVDALLAQGEADLRTGKLLAPAEDNAVDRFRSVLNIEPGNDYAKDGIRRTALAGIQIAEASFRQKDFPRADQLFDDAAQIAPWEQAVRERQKKLYSKYSIVVPRVEWSNVLKLPQSRYFRVYSPGPVIIDDGKQVTTFSTAVESSYKAIGSSLRFRSLSGAGSTVIIYITTFDNETLGRTVYFRPMSNIFADGEVVVAASYALQPNNVELASNRESPAPSKIEGNPFPVAPARAEQPGSVFAQPPAMDFNHPSPSSGWGGLNINPTMRGSAASDNAFPPRKDGNYSQPVIVPTQTARQEQQAGDESKAQGQPVVVTPTLAPPADREALAVGKAALDANRFDAALAAFESAAKLRPGSSEAAEGRAKVIEAIYRRGQDSRKGNGVARSAVEAANWYRKAADLGHSGAQRELGQLYMNGTGVTRDYGQAMTWFQASAQQGDAIAENCIGLMFCQGMGISKDYSEARKWFLRSANQGYKGAQLNLGDMSRQGWGVPKDKQEAAKWFALAIAQFRPDANAGDVESQDVLGQMYQLGEGTTLSYVDAVKWYAKAADRGYAVAQRHLGMLYFIGLGVSLDKQRGINLLQRAASQGDTTAQATLQKAGIGW
jgi:TPR repeat protein/curved DNA-binding protein CbpA